MRDPKAYAAAGRNDPLSDPQRREHPYDFVSLPDRPAEKRTAVGHDRYPADRLTGSITLVYRALMPLHVGSGVFETAENCGLEGGVRPVRGIVRLGGRPTLPGSSWKGAVRARFEAITASRLGLAARGGREPAFKVPAALKEPGAPDKGQYSIDLRDPRLDALKPVMVRKPHDLDRLSPAEALFGAMGYRGRVLPGEGRIGGPSAGHPLALAPLDSPVPHRLAKPGKIERTGRQKLTIQEVEGRKFYYDGEIVHERRTEFAGNVRFSSEDIDVVPAGSTITLDVRLESVTDDELGALLIAAGYGEHGGVTRLGGFKPVGLGKVELTSVEPALHRGPELRRFQRPDPVALDLATIVQQAIGGLVEPERLRELREVTTRRRPPEVKR